MLNEERKERRWTLKRRSLDCRCRQFWSRLSRWRGVCSRSSCPRCIRGGGRSFRSWSCCSRSRHTCWRVLGRLKLLDQHSELLGTCASVKREAKSSSSRKRTDSLANRTHARKAGAMSDSEGFPSATNAKTVCPAKDRESTVA